MEDECGSSIESKGRVVGVRETEQGGQRGHVGRGKNWSCALNEMENLWKVAKGCRELVFTLVITLAPVRMGYKMSGMLVQRPSRRL